MKRTLLILLLLLGAVFLTPAAAAETETAEEDINALYDSLPQETKDRLSALGIHSGEALDWQAPDPNRWFLLLQSVVGEESPLPVTTAGVLVGIVLLCAATEGLRHTLREPALSETYQAVCTVGAGVAMMVPLADCMSRVTAAAQSVTVFMGSFVPVYAAILATGGRISAAASYQTLMIAAAEGVAGLITGLILPLMAVSLALGLTGSVGKGLRIGAIGGWINRCGAWLLGTVSTLFVGCLSLQQIITGAADTVTTRAMRLSISSFVPVVGGALSEALTTVQGSFTLLRSTVGVFGIVAILAILLPPLCACVLWSVGLSLCGMVAETLELERLTGMFRTVAGVVKVLIGALCACGMVMILCTALVLAAGRGT